MLLRSYAVEHPPGLDLPARTWPWHVLNHAVRGVMTVHTSAGAWVVPPHRAVFVPAGLEHRASIAGRVDVRSLYFASSLEAPWSRPRALTVSPLLRELIVHVAGLGRPLREDDACDRRLTLVVLDQLRALPSPPLTLPLPTDDRARALAAWLRADAARSLDDGVATVGASRRTLERLFRAETGMTLGRWHKRARLLDALRLLAGGEPVTGVAFAVGYDSPSAFIAAFKRELGTTPARYFDDDG